MAVPVNKTNLSAGELAPTLWGRTDLQKYQAGVKTARNFFVDYRGGMTTRPGTGLVNFARDQQNRPCYIPFEFGSDQAYVLVLDSGGRMQIIFEGGLITETPIAMNAGTNTNPATVTAASGTWAAGDVIVVNNVTGLVRANGISGVNGRTFFVAGVSGDTLALKDMFGSSVDGTGWTAYTSGGTISRILSINTPWLAADLFDLRYTQSADVLTITHPNYATYEVKRLGPITWTVTPKRVGTSMVPPTSPAAVAVNNPGGSNPQFFYAYAITAVNDDTGEESFYTGALCICVNAALNQNTGVVNKISWNAAPNATSYKIYKAQPVPNGSEDAGPYFYGLAGKSQSLTFSDVNYEADFTTAPPTSINPFQSGSIASVTMETDGFGYITPTATVFDFTGSGAVLTTTVSAAGAITAVGVAQGGDNYSAPQMVFTETDATAGTGLALMFDGTWVPASGGFVPGPGSITISAAGTHYHVPSIAIEVMGAPSGTSQDGLAYCTTNAAVPDGVVILNNPFVLDTSGVTLNFVITDTLPGQAVAGSQASAVATLTDQNFPGVCGYFDQRLVVAASNVNPDTFWATRPGLYNNFDVSFPSQADDAITGTIVSTKVNRIRSLTAMTSGLIALTSTGAWQVAAAGSSASAPQALTPATATAGPQAFSGASSLQPLLVGADLLYEADRGGSIRNIAYSFYQNNYTGMDVSVLSNHLIIGKMVQWTYAEAPNYLIWAVRSDGILLTQTYLKEQEIYGWAHHDTRGQYISVSSIPEGAEDAVYFVVHRPLGGGGGSGGVYFLERLASLDLGGNAAANIPTNPENTVQLDCAVSYPLTYPDDTLTAGGWQPAGQIDPSTASIDAPGIDYPATPFAPNVDIVDESGDGSEGFAAVTTDAQGRIITFTVEGNGKNYKQPKFIVGAGGSGHGAALSARVMNLFEFIPRNAATLNTINLGDVVRVRGGKGIVKSKTSDSFLADMIRPLYGLQLNDERPNSIPPVAPGEWSCTTPVSIIGGLDHLTGATVGIVADGNFQEPQVVVDGCVTLDQPATKIIVGLMFTAQLGGLRLEAGDPTMQGRRKQLPAITLRAMNTRGVLIGSSWETLVEAKDRTSEDYGQPVEFQTGGNFLSKFVGVNG